MKNILAIYKDICSQVEYYQALLNEVEFLYKKSRSQMLSKKRVSGNVAVSIDTLADDIDKLIERHDQIEKLLELNKRMKKAAEEQLSKFDGLEYKVAYGRFVEGKTLAEIAEDLGYTEEHIRRISAGITRVLKDAT